MGGKLVRDEIPKIIAATGQTPVISFREDADEYRLDLLKKLTEEVGEYQASGDPEELADIMEVLYAFAEVEKVDLDAIRLRKKEERGGFSKRIILHAVEPALKADMRGFP